MKYRLNYRADLDGLRAVAIVPVVLYHLGVPYLPGGFVGVDVFFVLSGFLISRLVAREIAEGKFSILDFYDRRIRRLFPALFAMLLCSSIAAALLFLPKDFERFGLTFAAAAFFASNIAFWRQSGYFAPAAETMPLLHTWSLAVEEQFYILFPVVLLLLWRFARTYIAPAILLAAAASFALNVWGSHNHPSPTFYLLPTRAWELAIGCFLALAPPPEIKATGQRNAVAFAGLSAIIFAVLFYSSATPYPGTAAILPCFGTLLLIWAGSGVSSSTRTSTNAVCLISQILTIRPIVFAGKISYSLYLWHWPIIVFAQYASVEPLNKIDRLILLIALVLVSCISWRFIEQPLRQGKGWLWSTQSHRFTVSIAATAAIVSLGAIIFSNNGFPQRVPKDVLAISRQAQSYSPMRQQCHAGGNGQENFSETCVIGHNNTNRVVVFADSHGAELSYALAGLARQNGIQIRQITGSDCPPAFDINPYGRPGCKTHVNKMMLALKSSQKSTIIISSYYYLWHKIETRNAFWTGFSRGVEFLSQAGHDIIITGPLPPHPHGDLPTVLAKWVNLDRSPEEYWFPIDEKKFQDIDQRLRRIATAHNATFIPLSDRICGSRIKCKAYYRNHTIYFDDHHLSVPTARHIAKELILPVLTEGQRRFD